MKNIKRYKVFESQEESDINLAKESVKESLLELSDNEFKIDVFDDRFSGSDKYGSCFSVIISNEKSDGSRTPFNFQEVIDNVWQSFNIPSDYGFQFYAMFVDISKGKMYFVWSPLEATNLEEVLEGIGDVNCIGMTFIKEGEYKDKLEDNRNKYKSETLPGLEY